MLRPDCAVVSSCCLAKDRHIGHIVAIGASQATSMLAPSALSRVSCNPTTRRAGNARLAGGCIAAAPKWSTLHFRQTSHTPTQLHARGPNSKSAASDFDDAVDEDDILSDAARKRSGLVDNSIEDELDEAELLSSLEDGGNLEVDEFDVLEALRQRQSSSAGAGPSTPSAEVETDGSEYLRELQLRKGRPPFDAAAADGAEEDEAEEEGLEYPEPPQRAYYVPDLFAKAALFQFAQKLDEDFHDTAVYGLQNEPEKVIEGDLFICVPHEDDEGPQQQHARVARALELGATAVMCDEELEGLEVPEHVPVVYVDDVEEFQQRLAVAFYDAPSRDIAVVGVAGSSGKTTVSWLLRGILEEMSQLTGMVGSIEYAIAEDRLNEEGDIWHPTEDDPTQERDSSAPWMMAPYRGKYDVRHTTPDGLKVQKLLAGMRDRGATAAVLEASTSGLASGSLAWVDFDVAVFTNCRPDAGTPEAEDEGYIEQVAGLFRMMRDPERQRIVMNLDDPLVGYMRDAAAEVPAISYAINDKVADVFPESMRFSIWETEMIIRTPVGRLQIITPLIGRHNVYNVLAAVAAAVALNIPLATIGKGIEQVEVIPGRCEIIDEGQPFSVIVDAASTPAQMTALLDSLQECGAKRIFTITGCEGDRNKALRPYLGEVVHAKSDYVILTNCHPRSEPPADIIQDIVAGFPDDVINAHSGYVYFPLQDQGHVPLWFEPYLQKAQRDVHRVRRAAVLYVMEDRFSAIRSAIGTASATDVVVITGKGHVDYMEYGADPSEPLTDDNGEPLVAGEVAELRAQGIERAWFDDRVEARNALSKLSYLYKITKLEREDLPWGNTLDEMLTIP